ncbi:hypothetical protein [Halococcus sp. AFM35]|uniref:hypothetical protein n=1 Tax=Halococcus sp. AFM35 TaxID=3421653 RepID=UPI003EBA92F6
MNTFARLARAVRNPVLFARQANRLYYRRLNRRQYNHDGVDIFAEDWDTLVILDACRYDMFERHAELPGRLESRISRGSATTEFLHANFSGRDLRDTVYVTANPQLYRNREAIDTHLHSIVDLWREDGWDDDYGTVLPETLTEYALQAANDYSHKRLIIHYVQPHYPFIGSGTNFDKHHLAADATETGENIWGQLLTGALDASPEDIWPLYVANLERTLPHIRELLETIEGRTVVTADHGNMLGERSFPIPITEWGHPRGIYTEQLVRVPWLVAENGPRRSIEAEAATAGSETDEEVVKDRLRELGYVE